MPSSGVPSDVVNRRFSLLGGDPSADHDPPLASPPSPNATPHKIRALMAPGSDVIFERLRFRNLTIKNRLIRSSITGRLDNYDGSASQARVNWEEKFAA